MKATKHANDNNWKISYCSRKDVKHEIDEMKAAARDLEKRGLGLCVDSLFYDINSNCMNYELRFPAVEEEMFVTDYIDYVLEHHISQFINSRGIVMYKKKSV